MNLKDLKFGTPNGIRMARGDVELWGLMKRAGWQTIIVAPESGSEDTLATMKKDLKLPISIIIAAIIIAGAIYYSSTSEYRNALKACEALMMSDGSVTKKDLKEQDVFKNYLIIMN